MAAQVPACCSTKGRVIRENQYLLTGIDSKFDFSTTAVLRACLEKKRGVERRTWNLEGLRSFKLSKNLCGKGFWGAKSLSGSFLLLSVRKPIPHTQGAHIHIRTASYPHNHTTPPGALTRMNKVTTLQQQEEQQRKNDRNISHLSVCLFIRFLAKRARGRLRPADM
ncbi:unnamed protein product [Pylaiella littoralis]